MKDYNTLFNQIPIEYDLFALVLFANILFSVFISAAIFLKSKPENQPISFFKYGILVVALIQVDFFLGYTGLMKYVPWVNDSTNVLALLIPAILYFFIVSWLKGTVSLRKNWMHLLLPCLYSLIHLGIHIQSVEFKLNKYVASFHPHLSLIPIEEPASAWYKIALCVDNRFQELLLLSFLLYSIAIIRVLWTYRLVLNAQNPALTNKKRQSYHFSIGLSILFVATTIAAVIVFSDYHLALEERYIIFFPMLVIFFTSYIMISSSYFFKSFCILEKYHSTRLTISSSDTFQRIVLFIQENEYYLNKDACLNDLATQLSISPVYLSQIINSRAGKNFSTFINHYRIETAKKRLIDDTYSHLDIASIGETVGFKSRSSFYAVFKKHTQLTPAAYAKRMKK